MSQSASESAHQSAHESAPEPRPHPARIPLGPDVLVIRNRYESLSIANDVLLGIWFAVGSFLFFSETTTTAATVLFALGSLQMLIRPVIRLSRRIHLRRRGYDESGTQQDF